MIYDLLGVVWQPYTDAIMSYHTLGFRPGTDGDARYPQYITSNATSKFSGNIDIMSGVASAFPPQEVRGMLLSVFSVLKQVTYPNPTVIPKS
jgi:hypothetical protein